MKWIAHQIRFPDSSTTLEHQEGHSERVLRHVQLVADLLGKPLAQTRILDLACLEGGFSFELAMQAAEAVGLEGRIDNLNKCEAAKTRLGLTNCTFVQDDVRNLSKVKHGSFDVILCLGILYHLVAADGVDLLRRMYEVCERAIVIDTHIALFGEEQVSVNGLPFSGRTYIEFAPGTATENKRAALASSLDNENSFWMTEESLARCLKAIGFTSVMKVVVPPIPLNVNDRVTFVAFKGAPIKLQSCDMPARQDLPERTNPSILLASFTNKELVSLYRNRSTACEIDSVGALREQIAEVDRENQQLKKQLQAARTTLNSVLTSKGWRLLNHYRRVRDQLRGRVDG